MEQKTPRSRERQNTGKAKDIYVHGEGLGSGPVGSSDGHAGRGSSSANRGSASSGQGGSSSGRGSSSSGQGGNRPYGSGRRGSSYPRGGGRGMSPLVLLVIAAIILVGGGSGFSVLFGGSSVQQASSSTYGSGHLVQNGGSTQAGGTNQANNGSGANAGNTGTGAAGTNNGANTGSSGSGATLGTLMNTLFGGDPSTYTTDGTIQGISAETAGEAVASGGDQTPISDVAAAGSRQKRTTILGGGADTVTIMVYMCGTDLESRSGMATSDLEEMAHADLGSINLIVYTGGCTRWKNSIISSRNNQIYKVTRGGVSCLVENAGTGSMTDPATLASFIRWCSINYPANRNELIFWDHGGGSLSGFGYDEKDKGSGSMTLGDISRALKAADVTFDFIGFDACLMATTENALMLDSYADYMIASEETEPGTGWYYTEWLNLLADNTSMSTPEIGRRIADDFVKASAKRCPGQKTTLSVIDLAEFAYTVPEKLTRFAKSLTNLITSNKYQQVSSARNRTREFAGSTKIDQVDLVDLCENIGNEESRELAQALRSAVKYNTYNNITKASGVSIYFPYNSGAKKVEQAVSEYSRIGMDTSYAQCIREFVSLETAGQLSSGGAGSLMGSLFGGSYSQSAPSYETGALTELLGAFFGGTGSDMGADSSLISFFAGRSLTDEQTAAYIKANHLNPEELVWEQAEDGSYRMKLSDDAWRNIEGLDLNMFYDTGEGFIDLGLDNVYSFDERGRLVADTQKLWLSINDVVVPYYHMDTEDDGENYLITGRVPCLLNGVASDLILVFDNLHPQGMIAGARTVYPDGETETVAKALTAVENGDVIQAVADFYKYDGTYVESYRCGDPITVTEDLKIGNSDFTGMGPIEVTYRFRDIYNKEYWAPVIKVD